MTLYPYALLFHVVGVLGLFMAIGLEVTAMFRMRAAQTTAQVDEWMTVNRILEKILPASVVLILVSGLYMLFTMWGWSHAWIDLSLGSLIVLGVLSPTINGPRMKAIDKALEVNPDGPVLVCLQKRISDPVLQVYTLVPGCIALGAVALMILKLDWVGSVLVMVVAFAVSIILGQLSRGTPHNARLIAKETSLHS